MRKLRTSARFSRTTAGVAVAGLAAGLALAGPAAQAAPDRSDALAASTWLTSQLDGALLTSDYEWGRTALHGPTLDGVLALKAVGTSPDTRAAMLDAVEAEAGTYTGSGGETYVGAVAKLATTALAERRDVKTFAGGGLLPRLQERIVKGRNPQKGRATDASQWGDYSNTYSQAWTVRALSQAKARHRGIATGFLLKQQCRAGWFRQNLDSRDFTCNTGRKQGKSSPDVDATALAVMALREARAAGVKRLGDDIRDALRWLVRAQRNDGSFVGNGVSNANSTGLAAWALRTGGRNAAAAKAARWLQARLVLADQVVGTPLEGEAGAVSYNEASYLKAREDGITQGAVRAEWLVAATQAIPGLVSP